ncbi:uncharacterized protein LOC133790164 isoform X2 [Humulus lupulus]|uniref:uncharacterized protein LOC133790164 isoform X2 n=1 Tax=Humulus lupulus TaxID=3486 RepID=UPI002B401385|nr:uncharacterized protein LOC133790164 isoform X2 [Humulus lupulus]
MLRKWNERWVILNPTTGKMEYNLGSVVEKANYMEEVSANTSRVEAIHEEASLGKLLCQIQGLAMEKKRRRRRRKTKRETKTRNGSGKTIKGTRTILSTWIRSA